MDINIDNSSNKAPYLAKKVQKKEKVDAKPAKPAFEERQDSVEIRGPVKEKGQNIGPEQVKELAKQAMQIDLAKAPVVSETSEKVMTREEFIKDVKDKYNKGHYNQSDVIKKTAQNIADELFPKEPDV